MSEHHTRNTLEVTAWCPQCQQFTQHRCDNGRQGPCIDRKHPPRGDAGAMSQRQRQADNERRHAAANPRLFE